MSTVDNAILDLAISEGSKFGPMYNTVVIDPSNSGNEQRIQRYQFPRHKGDLSYGVRTPAQMQTLLAFFHARQGMTRGFLFWDNRDNSVSQQLIGTGDGLTQKFQLYKTYSSASVTQSRKITRPLMDNAVVEAKRAPVTPVQMLVAGVVAGYTVVPTDPPGVINITTAPAAGTNEVQNLTLTGSPTGGTFTLTVSNVYGTFATGGMGYNAAPSAIQAALQALPNVGTATNAVSNITCSGSAPNAGTTVITFSGNYPFGSNPQNLITGSGGLLTGGSSPAVQITRGNLGVLGAAVTWTGSFLVPVRFDSDWASWDVKNVLGSWDQINIIEIRE